MPIITKTIASDKLIINNSFRLLSTKPAIIKYIIKPMAIFGVAGISRKLKDTTTEQTICLTVELITRLSGGRQICQRTG